MKHCPRCQFTYDDSHAFCTADGSVLVDRVEAPPARPTQSNWVPPPSTGGERAQVPWEPRPVAPQAYFPPQASPPPPQQFHQMQPAVQHVVHHHTLASEPEGSLPTVALVGGIVCASLMLIGLVPCLGALNWIVIPLSGVTKILGWVTVFTVRYPKGRNKAIIGLVLATVAVFIGIIRLAIGGGCA